MENPPPSPQPSVLETLRTVEFRLGIKGYNVDEVDEYLEKAAVEAEALSEQFRQANERLRQATERISQLEAERRSAPAAPAQVAVAAAVSDDALQRTLLLAQKFVDQTKRESEAEAAEVVSKAEEQARSTLAQAEEQARELTTDADHRLREEVTRLEQMRGQLASDVENMARHLEGERMRLRTSLAEVLTWVEENIQPASSLMALRHHDDEQASDGEPPAPGPAQGRPNDQPSQGQLVANDSDAEGDRAEVVATEVSTAASPAGDRS